MPITILSAKNIDVYNCYRSCSFTGVCDCSMKKLVSEPQKFVPRFKNIHFCGRALYTHYTTLHYTILHAMSPGLLRVSDCKSAVANRPGVRG